MSKAFTMVFVDDSALVRDMVRTALGSMGHRVLSLAAYESPRLRTVIEEERPHAVILDVHMPMLAGDLLAQALGPAHERSYALLLCSGMEQTELARRARACAADGFIVKSQSVLALARDIAEAVDTAVVRRHAAR